MLLVVVPVPLSSLFLLVSVPPNLNDRSSEVAAAAAARCCSLACLRAANTPEMTRSFRRVLPLCFLCEAAADSDCRGSDADEGFDVEVLLALVRFRLRESLDLIPPPPPLLLLLPPLVGLLAAEAVRDALPDDEGLPAAADGAGPSSAIFAAV